MRKVLFLLFATVLVLTGCSSDNISALQAENEQLKEKLSELQEKETIYINQIHDLEAQVSRLQDLIDSGKTSGSDTGTESSIVIEVTGASEVTEMSSEFGSTKADPQAKFVVLNLEAENKGKKAALIFMSALKLFDSEDREFKISIPHMHYIPVKERFFSSDHILHSLPKEIAPGFFEEGKIVFEVPSTSSGFRLQVDSKELQTSIPITLN